jgi:1-acyl-sn-glycerol-3-phosphate acyltransferase
MTTTSLFQIGTAAASARQERRFTAVGVARAKNHAIMAPALLSVVILPIGVENPALWQTIIGLTLRGKKSNVTGIICKECMMLRARIYLLFLVPFTLLCSLCAVIAALVDGSGRSGHACARFWSLWCLRVARIHLAVSGLDRVPPEGPVIYMGNHQGNFDIHALCRAIPRRFSWIAKEELFRVPLFGAAMRRAGYIPLDRSDGRKALKSMRLAADRIAAGASVVIFPEGTRTLDGSLLPFKRGAFLLAARAGVPIVPFTINGSMQRNPRNRIELHPGTISVSFAPPIPTAGVPEAELMERVRAAVAQGLEVH